jgi:hypothetical protein
VKSRLLALSCTANNLAKSSRDPSSAIVSVVDARRDDVVDVEVASRFARSARRRRNIAS